MDGEQQWNRSEHMKAIWARRTAEERRAIFKKSGEGVAKANRGKKRTPTEIQNMREAALKNCENRRMASLKRWEGTTKEDRIRQTEPAIQAGAKAVKGKKLSQEHRAKSIETLAKTRHSKARLKNVSEAQRTPEMREKRSLISKAYWDSFTPEQRASHPFVVAGADSLSKRIRSSLEILIASILDELGEVYVTQKRIGPYVVDIHVKRLDLVIECDGAYWHDRTSEQKERDAKRDSFLLGKGCRLIRLKEEAIKRRAKEAVREAMNQVSGTDVKYCVVRS